MRVSGQRLKSASFRYFAPSSIDAVVELLRENGDEAKVLAGGQSLVPLMAMRLARFENLIDIQHVAELHEVRADDTGVTVSAMVRQSAAGTDAEIRRRSSQP